ncbi:hypothetical protein, partial [Streptomyces sp. NPDC054952]
MSFGARGGGLRAAFGSRSAVTTNPVRHEELPNLRLREDGQNITSRSRTADETVRHIERVMALVAERVQ